MTDIEFRGGRLPYDPSLDTDLAWHDVICLEAEECDFRVVHARSMPIVSSGLLERYHARLEQIRSGCVTPLHFETPLFDYSGPRHAAPKRGFW